MPTSQQPPPQRFAASLRGLADSLLGLFQVRLELLSVEAREEVSRLGGLLLYGAFAVAFLSLGLGFLAILITVALWDSHRLLALGAFSTLFLTLGVVAGFLARDRLQQGSRLFAASLEELQRDQDSLRP
jgi:uncharacterized membrane protein YqjE